MPSSQEKRKTVFDSSILLSDGTPVGTVSAFLLEHNAVG